MSSKNFNFTYKKIFQGPHEPNVSGEGNTNERRDINKNLIHYAELKKLKPRFYSEVLRKKFFVLYEDSRQSLTHPRDPSQSNGDLSDVSIISIFELISKIISIVVIKKK